MTILVLTPTTEAAERLSSALTRRGAVHTWATEFNEASDLPLVAVIDSALNNHRHILQRLGDRAPWCRRYLMGGQAPTLETRVVDKPFDAAALADLLVQESEVARLSRRQRLLISQTHDLAALVQNSFEAIVGVDRQGRVISWNQGAQTIYGYSASEMLGAPLDSLDVITTPWPNLAAGQKHVEERRRRDKSGNTLVVLVSRSRVAHASVDSALAMTEVSLDVTRKALLEKELEHSARLAHLGRIAATMSHEINNPLAVIRSCTDWLKLYSNRSDSVEMKEVAEDLHLASERISSYVSQMSGFVRRDARTRQLLSLESTIECVLRLMRPRAYTKNVSLLTGDLSGSFFPVSHDPARLTHAIVNVVANAIDAASTGSGTVQVSVTARPQWLDIRVEDDGPGIAPEIAPHLFEPFCTTKAFGEGTGLGLALTREVMRDHGGSATLTNRSPRGAIGILSLPCAAAEAQPESAPKRVSLAVGTKP